MEEGFAGYDEVCSLQTRSRDGYWRLDVASTGRTIKGIRLVIDRVMYCRAFVMEWKKYRLFTRLKREMNR